MAAGTVTPTEPIILRKGQRASTASAAPGRTKGCRCFFSFHDLKRKFFGQYFERTWFELAGLPCRECCARQHLAGKRVLGIPFCLSI